MRIQFGTADYGGWGRNADYSLANVRRWPMSQAGGEVGLRLYEANRRIAYKGVQIHHMGALSGYPPPRRRCSGAARVAAIPLFHAPLCGRTISPIQLKIRTASNAPIRPQTFRGDPPPATCSSASRHISGCAGTWRAERRRARFASPCRIPAGCD